MNDVGMGTVYVGHAATVQHAGVFESRGIINAEMVQEIKARAALLLAEIDAISVPPEHHEAARLVALAKTDLESCVMWAVKALSRNH